MIGKNELIDIALFVIAFATWITGWAYPWPGWALWWTASLAAQALIVWRILR